MATIVLALGFHFSLKCVRVMRVDPESIQAVNALAEVSLEIFAEEQSVQLMCTNEKFLASENSSENGRSHNLIKKKAKCILKIEMRQFLTESMDLTCL